MRFFTALKNYFVLNSAQKQFISNSKRKFNMSKNDIVNFLQPMANFDLECDLAIKQLFKLNLACFLTLFVALFSVGISITFSQIAATIAFPTLLIGLTARFILGRINIHNSLRELVLPLVVTLGEDMAPGKNIQMYLDLTGKLLKSKAVKSSTVDPGWFQYPKVTTTIYHDNWFDLQAELVDGSKVHIAIKDRINSKYKIIRSRSGKTKKKTKNKVKQFIKASVSLRHKHYTTGDPEALQKSCDRFKEKQGQNRQSYTMTTILQRCTDDIYPQPEVCVDLIGKIFMNAKPAAKGKQ